MTIYWGGSPLAGGGVYTVADTATLDMSLLGSVISGVVKLSGVSGNQLQALGDGLYVPESAVTGFTFDDTSSIDLTNTSGSITADARISPDADNIITVRPNGLYATAAGGGYGSNLTVSDTQSIDLTLLSDNLSAVTRISAAANNIITVNADGLYVPPASEDTTVQNIVNRLGTQPSDLLSTDAGNLIAVGTDDKLYVADPMSVADTSTIDHTYAASVLSSAVRVSAQAGNTISINADGLYVPNASGGDYLTSVADTATVDLTVAGSQLTADVIVSVDADNLLESRVNGLYVPTPDLATLGLSVTDGDTVDLTLAGSDITAEVIVDPDAGNIIEARATGLFAPAGNVTVADTNSVDLTLTGSEITADVIISPDDYNALTENANGLFVLSPTETIVGGLCQGRLSLLDNSPVPQADVTDSTLYYHPYNGSLIGIYNTGTSQWDLMTIPVSPISLDLSAVPANTNVDIFAYDNGGTLALESQLWNTSGAGSSTRSVTITQIDGVWVKSSDYSRRYLGTVRTNATVGQLEDSQAKRFVWNVTNQETRLQQRLYSLGAWIYGVTAWRPSNNSILNRVEAVYGLDTVADIFNMCGIAVPYNTVAYSGIGLDSTNTLAPNSTPGWGLQTIGYTAGTYMNMSVTSSLRQVVEAGYHYYQALEFGNSSGGYGTGFFGSYNSVNSKITGLIKA